VYLPAIAVQSSINICVYRDEDEKKSSCQYCGAKMTGRNLILSFDGTSNQFGDNVGDLSHTIRFFG